MHAGYKNVCIKVYFLKSNYALCCCVDYLCENNNEMGTTLIDGVIRGCGEDSLHLFSAPLSTVQFGGGKSKCKIGNWWIHQTSEAFLDSCH